jgi:enoyl-CoA hydratase/carnithine racemase
LDINADLIHITQRGALGIITLNRPDALNATHYEMVKAIHGVLTSFSDNDTIKHIAIMSSQTRAFCAGGDVKSVYRAMIAHDFVACENYFRAEYQLINRLATYSKPIYSFVDGICFGGGLGLSMHGAACIAGENALFSMPETMIGFFPDVGAGYFLNKLKSQAMGMYLGLTGAKFNRNFAFQEGLVTHAIDVSGWDALLAQLADGILLDDCVYESASIPDMSMDDDIRSSAVQTAFGQEQLADILKLAPAHVLSDLRGKSPFSIAVTHEFMKRSRGLPLKEILFIEFSLTMNFVKHGEFKEGVRARLIDKDNAPKWAYAWKDEGDHSFFDSIPKETIEAMFAPYADLLLDS